MAFESGFQTTLAIGVAVGDTSLTVATAPTITAGRIFLDNGAQQEWIKFTGRTGPLLTGLSRGMSKTAIPSTAGTGLTWIAGTKVKIVAMHDQICDLSANNTFTGNNTFSGDNTFSGSFLATKELRIPVFATEAARDVAIPSPADGDMVYVNDLEDFQYYKNGAWITGFGSGGGGGSGTWYKDSSDDGTVVGLINSSNTIYTISTIPGSANSCMVFRNGELMERTSDYTLVGSTITFITAPTTGDKLVVIYPTTAIGVSAALTRGTTSTNAQSGELYRDTGDSQSLWYKSNTGTATKVMDVTTNLVNTNVTGHTEKTSIVDADQIMMADSAASNADKKITYANLKTAVLSAVVDGTTSTKGILQLATTTEAVTGTDTAKAMTAQDVKYAINSGNWDFVQHLPLATYGTNSIIGWTESGNCTLGGGFGYFTWQDTAGDSYCETGLPDKAGSATAYCTFDTISVIELEWYGWLNTGSTNGIMIGIGVDNSFLYGTNNRHVCLHWKGNSNTTAYINHGDNSTNSETAVTITNAQGHWHRFKLRFTQGVGSELFVDGASIGTYATNNPSGGAGLYVGFGSKENNNTLYFTDVTVRIKYA